MSVHFSRIFVWIIPLVALLMITLMLIPTGCWKLPQNQEIREGVDPNLVYVKQTGSPADSVVDISENAVTMKAIHESSLDFDLFTFSYGGDFRAEFDVMVLDNQQSSTPLSIILQCLLEKVKYSLDFGPSPDNLLTSSVMVNDTITKKQSLGTYIRGYPYHVSVARYSQTGNITVCLSGDSNAASPNGHNVLLLVGGPNEPEYQEVVSELIPINAGEKYLFGATEKLVSGDGWYKLVVYWFDQEGRKLSTSNDWRFFNNVVGWATLEFNGSAPADAAFAQLRLGGGNGRTVLLATDVLLRSADNPEVNLVPNPFFVGNEGWFSAGESIEPLSTSSIVTRVSTVVDSLGSDVLLSLFAPVPVSLTLSTSSITGLTSLRAENFEVVIPSQNLNAMKLADPTAKSLVIILSVAGGFVILCYGAIWLKGLLKKNRVSAWLKKPFLVKNRAWMLFLLGIVLLYVVLNPFFFRLGSHYYDLYATKTWSYISARYGVTELYHLSNLAILPNPTTRDPDASPAFPYGPVMAYIFATIGSVSNLILPPDQLSVDGFPLEFALKEANVLVGLFSAILIYLILRGMGINNRLSLIGMLLFLFNPAILFMSSIWGETQTFSVFFILISIWLAQKRSLGLAWASLLASALTRPQMLIPAALLGLIYIKSFSIKRTVLGVSLGIVIVFTMLSPLFAALSPSLPLSWYSQITLIQQAENPVAAKYMHVSNDGYTMWPLITRFIPGLEGQARIFVSSRTPLIGSLTFLDVSNIVFLAILGSLAVTILFQRNTGQLKGEHLGLVATGMLALTMIRTGASVHHFTLALPLILVSQKSLTKPAYYSILSVLSVTTFLTMWGSIPAALAPTSLLNPATNPVTNFLSQLYVSDWFITLGSLANTAALLWLWKESVLPLWRKRNSKIVSPPA